MRPPISRKPKSIPQYLRKPTSGNANSFTPGGGSKSGVSGLASSVLSNPAVAKALQLLAGSDGSEIVKTSKKYIGPDGKPITGVKIQQAGHPIGSLIGVAARKSLEALAKKNAANAAKLTKPVAAKAVKAPTPKAPTAAAPAKTPGSTGVGPALGSAKEAASATRANFLKAGYSKDVADAAADMSSRRWTAGMVKTAVEPLKAAPKVVAQAAPKGAISKGAKAAAVKAGSEGPKKTTAIRPKSGPVAAERATIKAGERTAKTAAGSARLDKMAAKETSSSAPKSGPAGRVEGSPIAKESVKDVVARRLAVKNAGRRAGDDTGDSMLKVPDVKSNAQGVIGRPGFYKKDAKGKYLKDKKGDLIPRDSKATPKQAVREELGRRLIKPRNPGVNASPAKKATYQRNLAQWNKSQDKISEVTGKGGVTKGKPIEGYAPKPAASKGAEGPKKLTRRIAPPSANKDAALALQQKSLRNQAKAALKAPAKAVESPKKPAAVKPKPAPPKGSAGAEGPKKPSTELMRVPKDTGRKASGPQVKGGDVYRVPPIRGKEVAVRPKGGALVTRPVPTAAKGIKPKGKFPKKTAGVAAAALAAAGVAGYAFDKSGAGKGEPEAKPVAGTITKDSTLPVLTDKYGRQIGRAEFNKREAFRKKTEGKTPKQVAALKKTEMTRRKKFRSGAGKEKFGDKASTVTKNKNIKKGVLTRGTAASRVYATANR